MTEELTRERFLELCGTKGIFGVKFVKRDGTDRHMCARLGVKSALKGGKPAYDEKEHGIVTVYDMAKKGYRGIRMESVTEIRRGGKTLYKRKIRVAKST